MGTIFNTASYGGQVTSDNVRADSFYQNKNQACILICQSTGKPRPLHWPPSSWDSHQLSQQLSSTHGQPWWRHSFFHQSHLEEQRHRHAGHRGEVQTAATCAETLSNHVSPHREAVGGCKLTLSNHVLVAPVQMQIRRSWPVDRHIWRWAMTVDMQTTEPPTNIASASRLMNSKHRPQQALTKESALDGQKWPNCHQYCPLGQQKCPLSQQKCPLS